MPYNGSGVANRLMNWGNDANASIPITASRMDTDSNDFIGMFNAAFTRDGQSQATANWNMGGFKIGNALNGTGAADYATVGQTQAGSSLFGGTAAGTANAITFNLTPALSAYTAGQAYSFKAAASITGATTVNINGAGIKNVIRQDGSALVAGDIVTGQIVDLEYDGANFQLLNPFRITDSTPLNLTSVAGTNTITASTAVPLTAYVAGQFFTFKSAGANTTAVTLNVNGLGAQAVKLGNGNALTAGKITSGQVVAVQYDGANFQYLNSGSGGLLSVQVFAANGTYTPTPGTLLVIGEMVGGGGAGGGTPTTSATQGAAASGGCGATYQKFLWSNPTSQAVTIGQGGAGSLSANGGAGTTTSLGAIATAPGGPGGLADAAGSTVGVRQRTALVRSAAPTNSGSTRLESVLGELGWGSAMLAANGALLATGKGGNSALGLGGNAEYIDVVFIGTNGTAPSGYGSAGSGAGSSQSIATTRKGADGADGIVVLYEFG